MNLNGMNEHKKVICYSSHPNTSTLQLEKEEKKNQERQQSLVGFTQIVQVLAHINFY